MEKTVEDFDQLKLVHVPTCELGALEPGQMIGICHEGNVCSEFGVFLEYVKAGTIHPGMFLRYYTRIRMNGKVYHQEKMISFTHRKEVKYASHFMLPTDAASHVVMKLVHPTFGGSQDVKADPLRHPHWPPALEVEDDPPEETPAPENPAPPKKTPEKTPALGFGGVPISHSGVLFGGGLFGAVPVAGTKRPAPPPENPSPFKK